MVIAHKPKILLFDIETRYIIFRGWTTGKQWVKHDQIIDGQHPDIICISYKWFGSPQVKTLHWDIKTQNSATMINTFTKVVESADICIGHNADKFDIRHINTQRMLHNQDPIAWPTSDDTLKAIRRYFLLPSYSLDYLSRLVGRKGKQRMTFADWVDVVEKRSTKALAKMIRYNRNDVRELEMVYRRFLRYLKPKAHAGLITGTGKTSCPRCGSTRARSKGLVYLLANTYRRLMCLDCRHSYRGRVPV